MITKNVVNLYREASADTEVVTQALMGQPAWILEESGEWARVRTWDTYSGWIMRRWLFPRPDKLYASGPEVAVMQALITDVHERQEADSPILTKATISTVLEAQGQDGGWVVLTLPDGRTGFVEAESLYLAHGDDRLPAESEETVRTAKRFIGVPYLWGGTSPFGLDCSGFVQLIYRIHGITLYRDADQQAEDERAKPVEKGELVPTDQVFFAGGQDKTKITHTGMYIGAGRFIHSAGACGVTINSLEDEPYRANFWGARRTDFSVRKPLGVKDKHWT